MAKLFPLQHVTLHGHEVGYRMAGEGETVLLIHGMAGSSATWRDVMPALAERYCVIAPDLLGHGESAKPLGDYSLGAFASGLRDLLGVLGKGSAAVVGTSLGGGVAMQLAYQHPELINRLVLVGSGGLGREVNIVLRALTLPGADLLMPLAFNRYTRAATARVGSLLDRLGLVSAHVEEMWHAYRALTEVENRHAFVRTLKAVVDPGGQSVSAKDRLYLTEAMPTLIMWGDDDPIIPVKHGYEAHLAMPGSRLEIVKGAGHFLQVEAPEEFTRILLDFLSKTDSDHASNAEYRRLLVSGARPARRRNK